MAFLLHFKCDTHSSDSWSQSICLYFWKYDKTSNEDMLITYMST